MFFDEVTLIVDEETLDMFHRLMHEQTPITVKGIAPSGKVLYEYTQYIFSLSAKAVISLLEVEGQKYELKIGYNKASEVCCQ